MKAEPNITRIKSALQMYRWNKSGFHHDEHMGESYCAFGMLLRDMGVSVDKVLKVSESLSGNLSSVSPGIRHLLQSLVDRRAQSPVLGGKSFASEKNLNLPWLENNSGKGCADLSASR